MVERRRLEEMLFNEDQQDRMQDERQHDEQQQFECAEDELEEMCGRHERQLREVQETSKRVMQL